MEVDIQQFQSCLTGDSFRRFFQTRHHSLSIISTSKFRQKNCISISTSSDANAFSIRKTHFSASQPQAAAIRNPSGPRFEATARSSQRLWPCTGPPALPCGLRGPKSDLLGAVSIGDEPNLGGAPLFRGKPAVSSCERMWKWLILHYQECVLQVMRHFLFEMEGERKAPDWGQSIISSYV